MKKTIFNRLLLASAAFMTLALGACSDDDNNNNEAIVDGHLTFADETRQLAYSYENTAQSVKFQANTFWKVEVEQPCDWVSVTPTSGEAGKMTIKITVDQNNTEVIRNAVVNVTCGKETTPFTIMQDKFGGDGKNLITPVSPLIDPSEIPNYDKFFPNSEHGQTILRRAAKFSFAHYAESEHFFVFWDQAFGDDPNASSVPASMRVDINDLLAKAEHFFDTNVNKLGMTKVGQGKSYLDDYKMQIYLLYQDEWLATGSGYDNTIGALWVNPSTCQPVGSTIAHEIGHSFQYQVYCDQIKQGIVTDPWSYKTGFRYGFSATGEGGCAYWEQCAQWQAQVDYPEEMFGYHVPVWQKNCHRIFYHEWMRYASYWLQHYWVNKRGLDAYAAIWQESRFPEDPIETYTRLYNSGDMQATYDELYDYAAHMVYYDLDNVRQYAPADVKGNYKTELLRQDDGSYLVAYASAPGTTGFNVIALEAEPGAAVTVNLTAVAPGTKLDSRDPGNLHDGDEKVIGNTTTYNNQSNVASNFRYGFVSVKAGTPSYSPMTKTAVANSATYTMPADADELYLVVCATPDVYNRCPWNDRENDDEQWPYSFTLTGADVYGYSEPAVAEYTKVSDKLLEGKVTIDVNGASGDWVFSSFNLCVPEILGFLGLDRAGFESALVIPEAGVAQTPAEGAIVALNRDADGSLNNMPTANVGYWLDENGNAVGWGNGHIVYYEFSSSALSLGKLGDQLTVGRTYELRPTLIYTVGGVEKRVDLTITYDVK